MKCDDCGKFCKRLHDVWCNPRSGGIERQVCDQCRSKREEGPTRSKYGYAPIVEVATTV